MSNRRFESPLTDADHRTSGSSRARTFWNYFLHHAEKRGIASKFERVYGLLDAVNADILEENTKALVDYIQENPGPLNPEWVVWALGMLRAAGSSRINPEYLRAPLTSVDDREPPMHLYALKRTADSEYVMYGLIPAKERAVVPIIYKRPVITP